ncbi:MAG: hypothetical protein KBD76_04695 [Bacteriovorax sp.]|nr:hypothetical protein [Bacteriovorax sp.]
MFKFITFYLFVHFLNPLHALEVTHAVSPGGNFLTASTARSCSTFSVDRDSLSCNPALFALSQSSGLQLSIVGKAEGSSIDTGKKLIFEPITEALIKDLFQKNSYNSFSFNTGISFLTPYFKLSYSPYFALADILIFNPAFPEISLALTNRSTLSLTSGMSLNPLLANKNMDLNFGYTLKYSQQTLSQDRFSLYDLSTQRPEQLILFKDLKYFSADFGTLLQLKNFYDLKFSAQIKNVGSKYKFNKTRAASAYYLEHKYLFETYSQMGIGKNLQTKWGGININIESFFEEYFRSFDYSRSTLGLRYDLGLFYLLSAFSKDYKTFGMHFLSQNFDVGLTYMNERNIGKFQKKADSAVYLGIDFNL